VKEDNEKNQPNFSLLLMIHYCRKPFKVFRHIFSGERKCECNIAFQRVTSGERVSLELKECQLCFFEEYFSLDYFCLKVAINETTLFC